MIKIIKPRQSGKTSELIRMAEESNAYIITPNRGMAVSVSRLAEEQGHHILFPVTYREYVQSRFRGSHIRHILIDDADVLLGQVFCEVTIDAITMSEPETVQTNPVENLTEIRREIDKYLYDNEFGSEYRADVANIINKHIPGEIVRDCKHCKHYKPKTLKEGCAYAWGCEVWGCKLDRKE